MWIRALMVVLPLSFVALTWWSAGKVRENRALRQGDLVALLSESEMPRLHPFLPSTEADQQLVDVLHAPLIKVGASGQIEPALAGEWRWLKRVTVWFATPGEAVDAKTRLLEAKGDQWKAWKLDNVEAKDTSLRMTYADPMFGSVRDALRTARAKVLGVVILRIEAPGHAREVRGALVSRPDFVSAVQRVWFDGDDAFELAVTGVKEDFTKDVRQHLERSFPADQKIDVLVQAQMPTLEEPVLEFVLREDAMWNDGKRVSAQDVKATFEAIMDAHLAVPEVAGLRVVRAVEAMAPNRAHVVYWRHYGPAMCAWLGLPILPEAWLKTHPIDPGGHVFVDSMPPGAGPCAVEHRDYKSLVIRSARPDHSNGLRRLSLVTNLSGFSTQLGYSTNALDLFWPSASVMPLKLQGEGLVPLAAPPRHSLRVVFNTRNAPLDDVRVREALELASDRLALANETLHGKASPHQSLFAPGLWLSANPVSGVADPARAEQLLIEAGWLRGINGLMFKPTGSLVLKMLVSEGDEMLAAVAADLRMQWLKLGVQANVMKLPAAVTQRLMKERSFDVVLERKRLVPTWDHWSEWQSEEPGNVTGVANRQVDLLLEALRHEFDPAEAAKRTASLETMILSQHAVLPLVTINERALLRTSLVGESDRPWTLRDLLVKGSAVRP